MHSGRRSLHSRPVLNSFLKLPILPEEIIMKHFCLQHLHILFKIHATNNIIYILIISFRTAFIKNKSNAMSD